MSERDRNSAQPGSSNVRSDESTHRDNEPHRNIHHGDQPPQTSSTTSFPTFPRQASGNVRSFELPPLPQAFTSKPAGVSSMLNPTDSDGQSTNRRRKIPQIDGLDLPKPILPPLQGNRSPYETSSGGNTPTLSGASGPRRMLTAKSPLMHRAASLNQLSQPRSTYGNQQASSHPSPRTVSHAIEPRTSGFPALPAISTMSRTQYGYAASAPTSEPDRRTSSGASLIMRPLSESTSPRSSYSTYSHAEQASPTGQYGPAAMPTLSSAYSANSAGPLTEQGRHRQIGVPITTSSGQNVYQMMNVETTSGTVQLPVDVQGASRVADEKRRRNAGASARFRQRRKEKERESSTTIARLEQQIKDLAEDADFYKRERDYLAGVVLQVPGGERHFPRPQSPRHRTRTAVAGPSNGGSTYMMLHEPGRQTSDDDRNVRRRTSTVSLPPPAQVPGQAPSSATSASFPPPYFPPSMYGQPTGSQSQQGPSAPLGPGHLPPLSSRAAPATSHPHPQPQPPSTYAPPQWGTYTESRHSSSQRPDDRQG